MHFWRRIDKEARTGGEGRERVSRESADKRFTKSRACSEKAPKVSIENGKNLEEQVEERGEYLVTLRDSAYLAIVRGASGEDKREGEQGWEITISRI